MRKVPSLIVVIITIFMIAIPMMVNMSYSDQSHDFLNDSISSSTLQTVIGFSFDEKLSTSDLFYEHHVEPTLAISDNGTIFAGWKNSETHNGGGARVSFTKSVDGGRTWDFPTYMANFEDMYTRQSDPWLVWHDGSIYYAYLEFSAEDNSFSQITVARSSDYGATWSQAAASHGSYFADKETMVISDNGTIFVAYDDIDTGPGGLATVRLTRSSDGGSSFDEVSVISPAADGHVGPYLTLDNESNIFVAWTYLYNVGGNLLLDNSTDFGTTFGVDRVINDDGNYSAFTDADGRPAKTTLPVIRFDSYNRLYCLWADTFDPIAGSFDVYLRYSDDYGFSWSERILINHVTTGDQWMPDMDIDSEDRLHIVYYHEQSTSYRPYYRVVSFSGESRNITNIGSALSVARASTSAAFTRPGDYFTIRLDSNDIPHIVWTDGRSNEMDIYYSHGLAASPATSDTTTTSTVTTGQITTDTSTTEPTTTGTASDSGTMMIFVGGVIGFGAVLIVIIVLVRKWDIV
ncbi:MAG: sialidase family protein [Candidatus Thorarchaeota archaeon]